ncbi:MAG TPA: hypothetical protein VFA47_10775 [Candidatus Manganitrophaceae bacterium]|nr:hypothetical protein [Candidatus Manganitrophaceae bacterium]
MKIISLFNKRLFSLFRVGMPLFFLVAACARPTEPPRYLDEGEHHLIRLEKEKSASYSHPADLDLGVWERALESIVVGHPVSLLKRIFIQKSEIVGPAFTHGEAVFLASRFKAAAERAAPDEHIAFLLSSKENELSSEVTSGIAFVKGGELHIIFANHHTSLSSQRHLQVPRDTTMRPYEQDAFHLIAQPHQTKMESGSLERGQEGIVIDYAAMNAPSQPASAEHGQKEAAVPGETKLEERLQLLKKVRDEGLITEEEYTEKKKELLKMLDIK